MDKEKLLDAIRCVGIEKGDIVYVASDSAYIITREFHRYKKDTGKTLDSPMRKSLSDAAMDMVLAALQEAVGEEGTLLIPTYNWDFCRGSAFDYRKTKGQTGYLGNRALEGEDFVRTKHPIYSFAVWGKDSQHLKGLENTDSWGEDSPFAYLHHNASKAKFLNIGIRNTGEGFSFLHYVEQVCHVPFRYKKYFTAQYIDEQGVESERTYSMFVRDLSKKVVSICTENFLKENNLLSKVIYEDIPLKALRIQETYDVFYHEIIHNGAKNILFHREN